MGLLFGGALGAGAYLVSQNRNNVHLSTSEHSLIFLLIRPSDFFHKPVCSVCE